MLLLLLRGHWNSIYSTYYHIDTHVRLVGWCPPVRYTKKNPCTNNIQCIPIFAPTRGYRCVSCDENRNIIGKLSSYDFFFFLFLFSVLICFFLSYFYEFLLCVVPFIHSFGGHINNIHSVYIDIYSTKDQCRCSVATRNGWTMIIFRYMFWYQFAKWPENNQQQQVR